MMEASVNPERTYPVRIAGRLDSGLSRWLWIVKWLLAIPHYVVLAFLWMVFVVLTVVAFFAILFTGRYPQGIFDFNVGVLRWTWRVAFYSYGALGTDRYPPFTLGEAPDYPATLDVAYPGELSRGLVLVKWWLLAIPQYVVVSVLVGGGLAWHREPWAWGFAGGLIGLLAVFAGVALLFRNRYPIGIFDLVLGLDRWVFRVAAYASLMTDSYPPFRLDQGGDDPGGPSEGARAASATSAQPVAADREGGTRAGRVVLFVVGGIAAVLAFVTLAGGITLVVIDETQRDADGFLMSPTEEFRTSTYAIVSESANVDFGGADQFVKGFLGTVRIRSSSERPVFVGIAPASDVAAYLGGVERDVVTGISHRPHYSTRAGGAPAKKPAAETFWVASASGAGEHTLDWTPQDGHWTVIAMNADATRGVSVDMSIGAELDSVIWIGIGLLAAGALLATAAALAITAGARRR